MSVVQRYNYIRIWIQTEFVHYFCLFSGFVDKKKAIDYYQQNLHHQAFDHKGRCGARFTHNAMQILTAVIDSVQVHMAMNQENVEQPIGP